MAEITLRSFSKVTQTSVGASQTSVLLCAAKPDRKAIIICNTSTSILYLLFGDAAGTAATATTAHSVQMAANTSYAVEGFTGPVSGIWVAVNGQANITQFE